ncbi:MAG TPA: histidine phosphatase family protein [Mycobacteriales bacterium]|nr:histidine phosphatase family protein [Mycobacteriales bacterium]
MTDRTLVLIRHAKAVAAAASDEVRPLADRGRRDALAAGRWLTELSVTPDLVVVSPATRARETWECIAEVVTSVDRRVDDRIYDNTVDDLLDVVADVPDEVASLALVGHNPSMHGLAITLDDGDGDRAAQAAIRDGYPTCGIAVFDVRGTWSQLRAGAATLRAFEAPRG